MTDQADRKYSRQQFSDQLSSQELAFLHHWQLMINRLGGQKQAAETMDWSTSTVSRDYSGKTLPTTERLRELSNYLNLTTNERTVLESLLEHARDAQAGRRRNDVGQPGEGGHTPPPVPPPPVPPPPVPPPPVPPLPAPPPESSGRSGRHLRRWVTAGAVIVVVVLGFIVGMVVSPGGHASSPVIGTQENVQGRYPGEGVKTVSIPVGSLTSSLARDFRKERTKNAKTVDGYEFRSALNPSLCLTAVDTGPLAGQDWDTVQVAACKLTANQIWIPEQWEIEGQPYTHLVSDQYQTMCLSGQKTAGDTRSGNLVFLLRCAYPAGNQAWAFQTWYQNVAPGHQSFPIFVSNKQSLCLDTDPRHPGNGVQLWDQYAIAGQFWS